MTLRRPDGEKQKVTGAIPAETSDELLRTGYYAVGANQFEVLAGLESVLEHLETHFGLVVDSKMGWVAAAANTHLHIDSGPFDLTESSLRRGGSVLFDKHVEQRRPEVPDF